MTCCPYGTQIFFCVPGADTVYIITNQGTSIKTTVIDLNDVFVNNNPLTSSRVEIWAGVLCDGNLGVHYTIWYDGSRQQSDFFTYDCFLGGCQDTIISVPNESDVILSVGLNQGCCECILLPCGNWVGYLASGGQVCEFTLFDVSDITQRHNLPLAQGLFYTSPYYSAPVDPRAHFDDTNGWHFELKGSGLGVPRFVLVFGPSVLEGTAFYFDFALGNVRVLDVDTGPYVKSDIITLDTWHTFDIYWTRDVEVDITKGHYVGTAEIWIDGTYLGACSTASSRPDLPFCFLADERLPFYAPNFKNQGLIEIREINGLSNDPNITSPFCYTSKFGAVKDSRDNDDWLVTISDSFYNPGGGPGFGNSGWMDGVYVLRADERINNYLPATCRRGLINKAPASNPGNNLSDFVLYEIGDHLQVVVWHRLDWLDLNFQVRPWSPTIDTHQIFNVENKLFTHFEDIGFSWGYTMEIL